jgi:hypothetical protein
VISKAGDYPRLFSMPPVHGGAPVLGTLGRALSSFELFQIYPDEADRRPRKEHHHGAQGTIAPRCFEASYALPVAQYHASLVPSFEYPEPGLILSYDPQLGDFTDPRFWTPLLHHPC